MKNLKDKNDNKTSPAEIKELDELLLMLICSFYLNLSRNPANAECLFQIGIFEKLRDMKELLSQNEQSMTYTNSVFSKLLWVEGS